MIRKTRQHKRCNKKRLKKKIYDTTIKGIRNLFRLNKNEAIKNKVIRLEILGTFSACRRRLLQTSKSRSFLEQQLN